MQTARLADLRAPNTAGGRARGSRLLAAALLALLAAGCQSRSPETTGSIGDSLGFGSAAREPRVVTRQDVEALGAKYREDSGDLGLAMRYAQALRATDQRPQAVAVLQQAALSFPADTTVVAVRCDERAHPRMQALSGISVLTVGTLDDLSGLLVRGATG